MGPHGHHGMDGMDGAFSWFPFVGSMGMLLLLALLAVGTWWLWRQGKLPQLTRRRSPEDAARVILAERYARGDMTTDEFMERASVLNWTPGNDALPPKPRTRGGRLS